MILVTGAAGFVGFHTALRLLRRGDAVVGVDDLNDYYDVRLKRARLERLESAAAEEGGSFTFVHADVADEEAMAALFARHAFSCVIHLAAQAGVRYSLKAPQRYARANVLGFVNILEGCRHGPVGHLVYASTSSVYGANTDFPYREDRDVGHPLQLYAATKRANELMAHSYSHLFGLPTTGLRFFTVYGPWGRPDMAPFLFTRNIIEGRPIEVFNEGRHSRDFTYVDDVAEGVVRVADRPAEPDPSWRSDAPLPHMSSVPFRVYNIGNSAPVVLSEFIAAIEEAVGRKAVMKMLPMQAGDVPDTFADVSRLEKAIGWRPATPLREGIARFVAWYRDYYEA